MKANEAKLQPLIEGQKQYLVPLFQRPYSWERRQWQTLWRDIQELAAESDDKAHFMGAIVTMPAHTVPEGITKYLLIDGQQRLTTLLILLIAMRDKAKEYPGSLADKIHDLFLINKYQDDLDFFKLLPTQDDRSVLIGLIGSPQHKLPGLLLDAYLHFSRLIARCSKDELENLLSLVTSRLVFVSIVLAADDNAYVIFESLNFKGMPLTQADLIRNYFLMRVHVKKDRTCVQYVLEADTGFIEGGSNRVHTALLDDGAGAVCQEERSILHNKDGNRISRSRARSRILGKLEIVFDILSSS